MWLDGQLDDYMKQEVNNCENGGGGKILSYTFAEIIFNSLLIILYYLK